MAVAKISILVPQGVSVDVSGCSLTIKGQKGSITKKFSGKMKFEKNDNGLLVSGDEREKALMGTTKAIIESAIKGVTEGYSKKLKVLYAHFPATLEVKGKDLLIKNFLGEKNPRKAKIVGDSTKVDAKGQQLTISGPDKESVGQTLANLRAAIKIRKFDPRVFQDGIYETEEG